LRKIVFLEIKSGVSSLNKNERSIKECIWRGDISYEVRRK
jgi:predicted Holliday junction resolvase-like endonuclease